MVFIVLVTQCNGNQGCINYNYSKQYYHFTYPLLSELYHQLSQPLFDFWKQVTRLELVQFTFITLRISIPGVCFY